MALVGIAGRTVRHRDGRAGRVVHDPGSHCVLVEWSDGSVGQGGGTQGWYSRRALIVQPSLDHCPVCGRRIVDFDMSGCEDDAAQRWCVAHVPDDHPMADLRTDRPAAG
ncbi:hypothetical protein [Mycolicibacterium sphagni]|uniref:hypothetical protein n=1 Tax=Mycolicibacterium sphagni TaxID=1786 RepID=UPI0021F3541C|nr:hypothetical protein [Mycolicibacterium sphagni]MCV7174836.1 hypothetical protein [Mycolicibacterium sphagni]